MNRHKYKKYQIKNRPGNMHKRILVLNLVFWIMGHIEEDHHLPLVPINNVK